MLAYTRYLLWFYDLNEWKLKTKTMHSMGGYADQESKEICFSKNAVASLGIIALRELALHEVAHALVPDEVHGPLWKSTYVNMGGCGRVMCEYFTRDADFKWVKRCRKCKYKDQLCHRRYALWCMRCGAGVTYKQNASFTPLA